MKNVAKDCTDTFKKHNAWDYKQKLNWTLELIVLFLIFFSFSWAAFHEEQCWLSLSGKNSYHKEQLSRCFQNKWRKYYWKRVFNLQINIIYALSIKEKIAIPLRWTYVYDGFVKANTFPFPFTSCTLIHFNYWLLWYYKIIFYNLILIYI